MTNSSTNQGNALKTSQCVGVIGAGAMGAGIAQVAAQSGHKVFLYDQNEQAVFNAKTKISQQLNKRVLKGKLSQQAFDLCLENIVPVHSLKELADCDLVVEAIVEKLSVKQNLFVELEFYCKASCLLTSNTSSISITAIASKLTHPERFFGMHFFNPAPVMALVEVISGLASDKALADTLYQTCLSWGKKPVLANSNPGFIVNRVARPFYGEGLRIVEEGGASLERVDELIKQSGQFRMGPFELMDLIGHDVNYAVTESVFNAYYQDPRFKPSLAQKALVEAGFLGKKSGRGFYQYDDNGFKHIIKSKTTSQAEEPETSVPQDIIKHILVTSSPESNATQAHPLDSLLARFSDDNFYLDTDKSVLQEATMSNANRDLKVLSFADANIALTDGRTATERAYKDQINNLILIDLAFDYATVKQLSFSAGQDCSEKALTDAKTLFKMIGIELIQINDIAGLVLMRTLCMLTNEAADTCLNGVASAKDIDTAMCCGVNYPEGPISWGQRIGLAYVYQVLLNLQKNYGEERYRPSSLLRRLSFGQQKLY